MLLSTILEPTKDAELIVMMCIKIGECLKAVGAKRLDGCYRMLAENGIELKREGYGHRGSVIFLPYSGVPRPASSLFQSRYTAC
jgi:hypothetical protein